MEKKNIIISIIIGLVVFAVGGGCGVLYQQQAAENSLIKILTSKAVPSIIAHGEVTNISGKKITVSYLGDSVTVEIAENAGIYSFSLLADGKNTNSAQQKVDFNVIKKGDNLNIALRLLPDGTLSGQSVIINNMPAVQTPAK